MNVSPNFSPPVGIMKPYFLFAIAFYVFNFLFLLQLSPKDYLLDFQVVAWVHIYLIGFVMLSIFSAMSQLVPVISENKHYWLQPFRYLSYLIISGVLLLVGGFLFDTLLLLIGGGLLLLSMLLYALVVVLTILHAKRKNTILYAMLTSNFFLIIGLFSGLLMALSFNGYITIAPQKFLYAHTYGLIVGFVFLLILAVSNILIPMFGSTQKISEQEFQLGFYATLVAVVSMLLSPFILENTLHLVSFSFTALAFMLYMYQLYLMAKSRKRIQHDIWAKHTYGAVGSFFLALFLLLLYVIFETQEFFTTAMWLFFLGFIGGMIVANLYKIVPFLVWFHIYSPLIEAQPVPMLHELVPKKLATIEFFYYFCGLSITTVALLLGSSVLFTGGVILLLVSAVIFFLIINIILKTDI